MDEAVTGTAVFVQEACHSHRFIRRRDDSSIVERPERLRSVAIGIAAAIARLEEVHPTANSRTSRKPITGTKASEATDPDSSLTNALDRLTIQSGSPEGPRLGSKFCIILSQARASLLDDPAVKYIHGDIDGPGYIDKFVAWASQSAERVARAESEIPEGLHQADLYLCPESHDAVSGALGTVCEAVDTVVKSSALSVEPAISEDQKTVPDTLSGQHSHAFVSVRPPGHHCGEDTPAGFCFVNNVMVGAAHAHLKHGVNRIVVFDIDLHHGNGTQAIAWNINEEAYRSETEGEGSGPEPQVNTSEVLKPSNKPMKVFYGSLHDVMSYPCEDGKSDLIQAASTSLQGPHGQWIDNIHLLPYETEEEFFKNLYPQYLKLISRAEAFVEATAKQEEVIVFISCGFDASLHEYDYMSRHGRKVPTSFYRRFTHDISRFAAKYAKNRVISVLEGGYSLRALSSGSFAHLIGLADPASKDVDEGWWELDNLIKLENACKPRSRRTSNSTINEPWVDRVLELVPLLDVTPAKLPTYISNHIASPTGERMTLRERKKAELSPSKARDAVTSSPSRKPVSKGKLALPALVAKTDDAASNSVVVPEGVEPRKLPRVVLRVKAQEETT